MSLENIKEGLQRLTEFTALEVLSAQMPLDSLAQLNEPIDFYGRAEADSSGEISAEAVSTEPFLKGDQA